MLDAKQNPIAMSAFFGLSAVKLDLKLCHKQDAECTFSKYIPGPYSDIYPINLSDVMGSH